MQEKREKEEPGHGFPHMPTYPSYITTTNNSLCRPQPLHFSFVFRHDQKAKASSQAHARRCRHNCIYLTDCLGLLLRHPARDESTNTRLSLVFLAWEICLLGLGWAYLGSIRLDSRCGMNLWCGGWDLHSTSLFPVPQSLCE
ncbi:hypothetical protein BDZ85DRAFT_95234 [Elsinoe ampelina]|uniref:Uncharacterized protein n=1 Tax=Elsinoe ampelina TaxID=302913 RepID=A0A6A6GE42_9PEZI|nr:hypothetical protein BDZ85DRAFT_95234 [Elsinoe ampelina]